LARSSAGTTIADLRINGNPVTITIRPNTRVNILGVGILHLRRSHLEESGLEVYALQLVLSSAQGGLPAGAVVTVGAAQAGVRYH
jgi:hypothetical protein